MKTETTDLLVIGAGPAGISAALYARRGGLAVTVVTKGIETGGLAKAEQIENYYGFAEPISGKELLRRGAAGAERLGVQIVEDELLALSFNDTFDGFKAQAQKHEWEAPAVVLAAGASRRTLPLPGLSEFEGRGVSYCAICDAFFYRGKDVAVLGQGEYALEEARVLLPVAQSVTLLTDGSEAPADLPDGLRVETRKVSAIEGDELVSRVAFAEGESLRVSGVFIAYGTAGSGDFARKLGATVTVNAATDPNPAATIKRETDGGAQGVLVTAVGRKAFEQAIGMVARGGTVALNGLPPGDFPLDIFGMVLNGITVRGSIVGTRLDLQESLDFAGQGKVKATVHSAKLEDINDIFAKMHKGQIEGRMVMDLTA